MSDLAIQESDLERRRVVWSIGLAVVLHGAILLALALGPGRALLNPPESPGTIDIVLAGAPAFEDTSAAPLPDLSSGGPTTGPAAATGAAAVSVVPATGGGAGAGGFVIPTPRATASGPTASSGGAAFRQSGSKTGVAQSLPDLTNQPSLPTITTAGTGSGQGTGATQRAGQGVTVAGTGAGSGPLELGQLDAVIAGTQGTGGSGSGTGTGTGTVQGTGTNGTGTEPYTLVWDKPDASVGRTVVTMVTPKIPPTAGAQGLALSVTVGFTLTPGGLLSGVKVELSSGFADVDTAVLDALRRWLFTPVKGTASVTGQISYVIRVK